MGLHMSSTQDRNRTALHLRHLPLGATQSVWGKGAKSCATTNCNKLARSAACTNKMCKDCCMSHQLRPCAYCGHQNTAPVISANGDPSALARPPAVVPGIPLTDLSRIVSDGPPTLFSKPMSDAWAADWDRTHEAYNSTSNPYVDGDSL